MDELAESASATPASTKLRRYTADKQVIARVEISGPQRRLASVHAGVDVRGDGSTGAYLGRVRRRSIDTQPHEHPVAAIRAVLEQR